MTEIRFRWDMGVELIEAWGSDRKVAQAARVSTEGLDNDREKFVGLVRALMSADPAPHWSPFQHSGMTIAFEVPLDVRTQMIRHQSMAVSEFSMRYSIAKPEFWIPNPERPLQDVGKRMDYRRTYGTETQYYQTLHYLKHACTVGWEAYKTLLDAGVTREVARKALPQSVYTQLWLSGSLRSWIHFLEARWDKHTQIETQEVAGKVAALLEENYPVTYEAWRQKNG